MHYLQAVTRYLAGRGAKFFIPSGKHLGDQPEGATTENGVVKRHLLRSFGLAFLLASPIWLTVSKSPNYLNCGLSAAIGILLLLLRASIPAPKPDRRPR